MYFFRKNHRISGIALVVVLSLIVIICLILIAFVTAMRLERSASASYSQSIRADETARGALNLIITDLQNEMSADAPPDTTYPSNPLYTNVTAQNIQPQKIGANTAMPDLVRISTNTTFKNAGGAVSSIGLKASPSNSATPSQNGRYMDAARWNAPFLGTFPTGGATPSTPSWVIVTRGGATDGASATFSGASAINNAALGNTNFAVARFAYAVYNVGGLMDVNIAGYPKSLLSMSDVQPIKGTLAGADTSAVNLDPNALTQWRNPVSAATGSSYVSYITGTASAKAFKTVAAGDTTFLSRQDLIKAAQAGVAGLTASELPDLTVFSRERNAPSWKPATPDATNPNLPQIRRSTAATITSYNVDGGSYTYDVEAGDPVVYQRFPLDRLRWIGPAGPQNGGNATNIQACFGLQWDSTRGIWKYVGASGSTLQSSIKTLSQVSAETAAREPNFFELLQAGILAGSLGLDGNPTASFNFFKLHEASLTLHILRIGASILSQYGSNVAPVVIEYNQSGGSWQASGVDNLPYLNMMTVLTGANSPNSLGCYLVFGLWNPHQGTVPTARPQVRLHLQGSVLIANAYGTGSAVYGSIPGYTTSFNTTIELASSSSVGVNGFTDPQALRPEDLVPTLGAGTAAGGDWTTLPPIDGVTYAGFRLPDFVFDAARIATDNAYASLWGTVTFRINPATAPFFNCWLEYKNADGVWLPYNYFIGINDSATWMAKSAGMDCGSMGLTWNSTTNSGLVAAPVTLDPPDDSYFLTFRHYLWESPDPRTLRFNPTQHATVTDTNWSRFLYGSMWSSDTDTTYQPIGRFGQQVAQQIFGPPWAPAGVSRNNNAAFVAGATTSPASYLDPDGVRRLADSGLFTNNPSTNGWKGDPYAKSTDRTADRPIILNRPFRSVAELGYVCRDYPWRTLDFFTANSADGALLDLFTTSQSTDPVLPGRLNLNTASAAALTALLQNSLPDPLGTTAVSKSSDIASALSQTIATTPIIGKGEIATRLVPNLSSTVFGDEDEEKVKARREVVARALADVGQTRTWNLLIDVVAQAGRYPAQATSLDQFNVEAEKRYWLHVAIDRYTGKVVDQQLEPVSQ